MRPKKKRMQERESYDISWYRKVKVIERRNEIKIAIAPMGDRLAHIKSLRNPRKKPPKRVPTSKTDSKFAVSYF